MNFMNWPAKRPLKRELNNFSKRMRQYHKRGAGHEVYVIDCRCHPCSVLEFSWHPQDLYGADVVCKSLISGTNNGCSYMNCGIEPITKERALAMAEYAKMYGERRYLIDIVGYTEDDVNYFEENWALNKAEAKKNDKLELT
jgi:hypothetical protein